MEIVVFCLDVANVLIFPLYLFLLQDFRGLGDVLEYQVIDQILDRVFDLDVEISLNFIDHHLDLGLVIQGLGAQVFLKLELVEKVPSVFHILQEILLIFLPNVAVFVSTLINDNEKIEGGVATVFS